MLEGIKNIIKNHTLILIYTFVLSLLVIGIYSSSGTKHFTKITTYTLTLFISYALFYFLVTKNKITLFFNPNKISFNKKIVDKLSIGLFILIISFISVHFILMNGIPALKALSLETSIEVAQLRRSITQNAPRLLNYFTSFSIRALIPFLILFFYSKRKMKWYWVLLIIGSFYAFSMMQKSHIVSVISPVLCYSLLSRKYYAFLLHLGIILLVVYSLTRIANVSIYKEPTSTTHITTSSSEKPKEKPKQTPPLTPLTKGLINRVLYIPGTMVSKWFDLVPETKPFLHGDGYRIIAAIKKSEYHNYAEELYPIMYPEYAKRGLKGNVNTASFAVDYANFGFLGLTISGIILSLFFIFIESVFKGDFKTKLSLNLYPTLIIGSAMLSTTLFSGGWGLILLLYFFFIKKSN